MRYAKYTFINIQVSFCQMFLGISLQKNDGMLQALRHTKVELNSSAARNYIQVLENRIIKYVVYEFHIRYEME